MRPPATPEFIDEFRETALPHLNAVYRFACRLARDPNVAEDLAQETFLQAWKSFRRFDRGGSCRAWLFGILYFVWSHERRRRGRELVVFDDAVVDAACPAAVASIPDHLTDEAVLAALKRLPDELQEIVILTDVEGFAYRETASLLKIPLGTVMSRLNRARKRLRAELADCEVTCDAAGEAGCEAGAARVIAMRKTGR